MVVVELELCTSVADDACVEIAELIADVAVCTTSDVLRALDKEVADNEEEIISPLVLTELLFIIDGLGFGVST